MSPAAPDATATSAALPPELARQVAAAVGTEPEPTNIAVVAHDREELAELRGCGALVREIAGQRVHGKEVTILLGPALVAGAPRDGYRERLLVLAPELRRAGALAWVRPKGHREWSEETGRFELHKVSGGEAAIVVVTSDDRYDPLRLERTAGGGEGLGTEDIIHQLEDWERRCEFEILAVSADQVELVFRRLPEDVDAFADDVYAFCPDVIGQTYLGPPIAGGDVDDYMEAIDEQTASDLARALERERRLVLWWD